MANRKFQLLMSEFTQLTNGKSINLNVDQSLACHYSGMDCYVEDGARIGLHGQVLVIVPIVKKLAARQQVRLNSSFDLTRDGYVAEVKSYGCCFVRHLVAPEHPQVLLKFLSETVSVVNKLKSEITKNVAS
ncbi:hypothetical protein [Vibrio parahaemolyticus]|uniref:hypothetical protein n=1 Tax=Vibrio parahaemolyticus TaxID=670 RepID=UPI00226A3CD9|nr:hypothetical protein [Vibrio parahaemolyticus]MCX8768733.1 hypothetical protein [Vibrio parahaemolyticus]MCX8783518.1 hypothetical protein [Vibrio parahaemolyticus]